MRLLVLVRESLTSAWAGKIPSLLVALVSAATCVVVLSTLGQSAANAARVQESLEGAGARTLTISDKTGAGFLNARTLGLVSELSTVEVSLGLGVPYDTVNTTIGRGGTLVTGWPVHATPHDWAAAVRLVRGRWPRPGEGLVSADGLQRLGLAQPVGDVMPRNGDGSLDIPIVGEYVAQEGFEDLDGVLINADGDPTASALRVVITDIPAVAATQSAILRILDPDPNDLYLESPTGLAELSQVVGGQLAASARVLLLGILAAGAFFVAVVVLADVLIRRRDLGRRRTLGITRADLTALVTLRAVLPALAGAVLGCAAAQVAALRAPAPVPLDFTVATGILGVVAAAVAAVLPAAYAAFRDPVTIMRTP